MEKGRGKAVVDDQEYEVENGSAVVVPAGSEHNVIDTSEEKDLKLHTIYSPPEYRNGVEHNTKEEAMADDEHFDGKTTE